jgi:hypothetical protein
VDDPVGLSTRPKEPSRRVGIAHRQTPRGGAGGHRPPYQPERPLDGIKTRATRPRRPTPACRPDAATGPCVTTRGRPQGQSPPEPSGRTHTHLQYTAHIHPAVVQHEDHAQTRVGATRSVDRGLRRGEPRADCGSRGPVHATHRPLQRAPENRQHPKHEPISLQTTDGCCCQVCRL